MSEASAAERQARGATSLKESRPSPPSRAGNFFNDLPRASSSSVSSLCLILSSFSPPPTASCPAFPIDLQGHRSAGFSVDVVDFVERRTVIEGVRVDVEDP